MVTGIGVSEAVAEANALLSVFRGKLRRLYLHYLKWFRRLKRDPVHEEVMKTLRRVMDEEEGMDYEEAADTAVDWRKFLLNRMFHPRPVLRTKKRRRRRRRKKKTKETKKVDLETTN